MSTSPERAWLLEDLVAGARFAFGLPAFLRRPVSRERAQAIIRRRFEQRQADFLSLARRAIYDNPRSPYRRLLELAGCQFEDLAKLVAQADVEGALGLLYRQGIYLTVDEFKGRQPVVRGSTTLWLQPSQFRNPQSSFHLPAQTSGSRGGGTPIPIDLAFVRERSVDTCLAYGARGGAGWRHAVWAVPGSAAMVQLLQFSGFGASPERWFSQVDPDAPGLHPRYRWSARALRWGSLLARVPLPPVQYVELDEAGQIAKWMAGVLQAGHTPHLYTYASSAVRLCEAALDQRIELRGAQFTVGSEPVTMARLAAIQRTGALALPRYANTESGPIAFGCLAPAQPDDVHLLHDLQVVTQPGPEGARAGLPPRAVLLSSLRPTVPLVLLNVSLGDQAEMVERDCGCPMQQVGWSVHLHSISSFEKLTIQGMTFLDNDVVRVLEEVLPARFGGGPTDYQLVEDNARSGQPVLRLLVHPSVGLLDDAMVLDALLDAIGSGPGVERVMALHWRNADCLRLERRPPVATASGKILHLHVGR